MKKKISQETESFTPEVYVLLHPFNWFGRTIPKGTLYVEIENDRDRYSCYCPDGTHCPHWNLTFMTVRGNPAYFMQLPSSMLRHVVKNCFV
ncbi:MAG: hypothetical protein ACFB15_25835 [Cyclobacteriaceae bacterium]